MKTIKNSLILLTITILTITFHYQAAAQLKYYKGYVIPLKGDTLKGEIESNPKKEIDHFRKIKYRARAGMPTKGFIAGKIKEYKMDSTIFISRKIDDQDVFIKLIVPGKINIYEGRTEDVDGKEVTLLPDYFYLKGEETVLVQDKPSRFKKQMMALMADNTDITKAISDDTYTYSNVLELFKAYNK